MPLLFAPVTARANPPLGSEIDFVVFPVGINLGQRNVIPSTLIRGLEDGTQAVNFEDWLIPFNDVITALQLEVTPTEDGQLEVRSPGLVTRIDPDELPTDSELGLAISIRQVETLFNVPTEFDLNEYAIQFNPPWLNLQGRPRFRSELPVVIEGLPLISPPNFTLTNLSQRIDITGTETNSIDYQGELAAVGTIGVVVGFFGRNKRI
ncbi:MAG: hypothetical protein SW833_00375 [Cyanobacteriota bacterium]|nr:hypothetical protein [Cyanobacteriota bacterium]